MYTVEQENAVISQVCDDFKKFLTSKNTSYNGAFAQDVKYGGSTIPAMDTINVRITDKIRRLQSGNVYAGDNDEDDLLGYLILKKVLKTLQAQVSPCNL
jgi:hypothetical protein